MITEESISQATDRLLDLVGKAPRRDQKDETYLAELRECVESGANVCARERKNHRPVLNVFIGERDWNAVCWCLRSPCPIDFTACDNWGHTPLHALCYCGNKWFSRSCLQAIASRLQNNHLDKVDWQKGDFKGEPFILCATDSQLLATFWDIIESIPFFQRRSLRIPVLCSVWDCDWSSLTSDAKARFILLSKEPPLMANESTANLAVCLCTDVPERGVVEKCVKRGADVEFYVDSWNMDLINLCVEKSNLVGFEICLNTRNALHFARSGTGTVLHRIPELSSLEDVAEALRLVFKRLHDHPDEREDSFGLSVWDIEDSDGMNFISKIASHQMLSFCWPLLVDGAGYHFKNRPFSVMLRGNVWSWDYGELGEAAQKCVQYSKGSFIEAAKYTGLLYRTCATASGKEDEVREYIENDADVNFGGSYYEVSRSTDHILHLIVLWPHPTYLDHFLCTKRSIRFNVVDAYGRTAFHRLCYVSDTQVAVEMLKKMVRRIEETPTDIVDWGCKDLAGHDFLSTAAFCGKLSQFYPVVKDMPYYADSPSLKLTLLVKPADWFALTNAERQDFTLREDDPILQGKLDAYTIEEDLKNTFVDDRNSHHESGSLREKGKSEYFLAVMRLGSDRSRKRIDNLYGIMDEWWSRRLNANARDDVFNALHDVLNDDVALRFALWWGSDEYTILHCIAEWHHYSEAIELLQMVAAHLLERGIRIAILKRDDEALACGSEVDSGEENSTDRRLIPVKYNAMCSFFSLAAELGRLVPFWSILSHVLDNTRTVPRFYIKDVLQLDLDKLRGTGAFIPRGKAVDASPSTASLWRRHHDNAFFPDILSVTRDVQDGADIMFTLCKSSRQPILHIFVRRGNVSAFKACLEHTNRLIDFNLRDFHKRTVLHYIALCEKSLALAFIRVLVAHLGQLSLDQKGMVPIDWLMDDENGGSFLKYTIEGEIFCTLWPELKRIAPFSQVDPMRGDREQELGVWRNQTYESQLYKDVYEELVKRVEEIEPFTARLQELSEKDTADADAVRWCVQNGAYLSFQKYGQEDPILHSFFGNCQVECVWACMETERSIDFTSRNTLGYTPLDIIADESEEEEAVKLLLPVLHRINSNPGKDKIEWLERDSRGLHFFSHAAESRILVRLWCEMMKFSFFAALPKPIKIKCDSDFESDHAFCALSDEDKKVFRDTFEEESYL